MKILIHCGHYNIKNNCVASLRSGTGAPGEADFNWRIGIALEKLLQEDGHSTYLDDANTNCKSEVTGKDWDLALAIHGDANIYGTGGGFADFPEPSTDEATKESQRIAKAITERYFPETGIVNHPERSNSNTRYYYLWQYLSAKTPCVILECGVLLDAHDSVILNDTQRVAKGIREGIRKAFGTVVVPPTPPDTCKAELKALKKEHENCNLNAIEISSLKAQVLTLTTERNEAVGSLQARDKMISDLRTRIDKAVIALQQ